MGVEIYLHSNLDQNYLHGIIQLKLIESITTQILRGLNHLLKNTNVNQQIF